MKLQRDGKRVSLRPMKSEYARALYELRTRNQAFFTPFEPLQQKLVMTLADYQERIRDDVRHWRDQTGYSFGVFLQESGELIGRVSLSNIVYGAWKNCTIGYFLDQAHNGQGLMTEAVALAVDFALTDGGLHRVQAAVMPWNLGSVRVVEKVGFRFEGLSKYYLQINGQWEDHNIYAITQEDWVR
ncbi:GNAT family N-acetyltransferase [Tumebacillus permanentifrigoris]|uniref:Ribosomal-protein-alanine N-acetyltransferase n=1 Tax=Tumebacillus permanentifrigoris TaxID=378543 RepID=A0A316D860_9BACL|nr:GNAT family protein [Tumebacillus permanentifrigoris]PWK09618.1 ribosomal-protein-alanine N-acetyltransferase [Tumebacillus permanentifrigoris]